MALIKDIPEGVFRGLVQEARNKIKNMIKKESSSNERASMAVISATDGKVAIVFGETVDYVAMSPEMTIQFIDGIIAVLANTRPELLLEHFRAMSEALDVEKH